MYAISHMFDSEVESLNEMQTYILWYILNSLKLGGVVDWYELKESHLSKWSVNFQYKTQFNSYS